METESDGQREVSLRLQKFLLCFCDVIQELAFDSHKEEIPTHNVSQLLGYPNNQQNNTLTSGRFASFSSSAAVTWEQRMLCCLANCAYCNKSFFHRVGKLFER